MAGTRVPALDGLRGCLAAYVAFYHTAEPCPGDYPLQKLAQLAVVIFFVLSGWVLTRGWDGRFGVFLVRRFVRLWPTFAFGMLAGCVVMHMTMPPSRLLWFPMASPYAGAETDRPAWSLFVEAWAMPFMPLFVWSGRRAWRGIVLAVGVFFIAMLWRLEVLWAEFFVLGACLSRVTWRNRWLESAPAQWLGKVSYSLYLTHWLVVQACEHAVGPWGRLPAALLIPPVAWLTWRWIEAPSISLSRAMARPVRRAVA
jgi:peptidoglycan/LPS O-acetylase OafA/YrhL